MTKQETQNREFTTRELDQFADGAAQAARDQIAAGLPADLVLNGLLGAVIDVATETSGAAHTVAWLRAMAAAVEAGVAEARRMTAN
jgi:hypothetical protein